ncbi:hypothetical protein BLJAPNOD_05310 [Ensifer sp. M14]|uniref:Uncharacterized protein n=1 Tax=Sinorhizobium sp. M14 TaxID=430451 RepID=A0A142BPU9_9HYPH|nr:MULTISPECIES: hypothetical protein [Sinorhizobium/Ensifer group]AMP35107.1 hypothetical protein pSinB_248 [Sinorhizobium sp. M14]RDL48083.1 hypothetical protein BLJAPNOD_05310 [Ensifer sp. M14]
MKSPWKYLVELASLGRAAKEPDRAPESPTDQPRTPPVAPADAPSAQSLPDIDTAEPMAEVSNETAANLDLAITDSVSAPVDQSREAGPVSIDRSTDTLLPDRARSTQPRRSNGQIRTKSKRVKNLVVEGDVPFAGVNSAVQPPPMTFLKEVTALDQEIMQLRHQLAAKLRLQNRQLKKMLDRYDA